MKIKVVQNNEIRLWKYSSQKLYQSLLAFIAKTFNLKNPSKYSLQYQDDEGDNINIQNDRDIRDAILCAKEESRKSLKIYIVSSDVLDNFLDDALGDIFGMQNSNNNNNKKKQKKIKKNLAKVNRNKTVKTPIKLIKPIRSSTKKVLKSHALSPEDILNSMMPINENNNGKKAIAMNAEDVFASMTFFDDDIDVMSQTSTVSAASTISYRSSKSHPIQQNINSNYQSPQDIIKSIVNKKQPPPHPQPQHQLQPQPLHQPNNIMNGNNPHDIMNIFHHNNNEQISPQPQTRFKPIVNKKPQPQPQPQHQLQTQPSNIMNSNNPQDIIHNIVNHNDEQIAASPDASNLNFDKVNAQNIIDSIINKKQSPKDTDLNINNISNINDNFNLNQPINDINDMNPDNVSDLNLVNVDSDKINDLYQQYDNINAINNNDNDNGNNDNINDNDQSFDGLFDLPDAPNHAVSKSIIQKDDDVSDDKPDEKTMQEIRNALYSKSTFKNAHLENLAKMQQDLDIANEEDELIRNKSIKADLDITNNLNQPHAPNEPHPPNQPNDAIAPNDIIDNKADNNESENELENESPPGSQPGSKAVSLSQSQSPVQHISPVTPPQSQPLLEQHSQSHSVSATNIQVNIIPTIIPSVPPVPFLQPYHSPKSRRNSTIMHGNNNDNISTQNVDNIADNADNVQENKVNNDNNNNDNVDDLDFDALYAEIDEIDIEEIKKMHASSDHKINGDNINNNIQNDDNDNDNKDDDNKNQVIDCNVQIIVNDTDDVNPIDIIDIQISPMGDITDVDDKFTFPDNNNNDNIKDNHKNNDNNPDDDDDMDIDLTQTDPDNDINHINNENKQDGDNMDIVQSDDDNDTIKTTSIIITNDEEKRQPSNQTTAINKDYLNTKSKSLQLPKSKSPTTPDPSGTPNSPISPKSLRASASQSQSPTAAGSNNNNNLSLSNSNSHNQLAQLLPYGVSPKEIRREISKIMRQEQREKGRQQKLKEKEERIQNKKRIQELKRQQKESEKQKRLKLKESLNKTKKYEKLRRLRQKELNQYKELSVANDIFTPNKHWYPIKFVLNIKKIKFEYETYDDLCEIIELQSSKTYRVHPAYVEVIFKNDNCHLKYNKNMNKILNNYCIIYIYYNWSSSQIIKYQSISLKLYNNDDEYIPKINIYRISPWINRNQTLNDNNNNKDNDKQSKQIINPNEIYIKYLELEIKKSKFKTKKISPLSLFKRKNKNKDINIISSMPSLLPTNCHLTPNFRWKFNLTADYSLFDPLLNDSTNNLLNSLHDYEIYYVKLRSQAEIKELPRLYDVYVVYLSCYENDNVGNNKIIQNQINKVLLSYIMNKNKILNCILSYLAEDRVYGFITISKNTLPDLHSPKTEQITFHYGSIGDWYKCAIVGENDFESSLKQLQKYGKWNNKSHISLISFLNSIVQSYTM